MSLIDINDAPIVTILVNQTNFTRPDLPVDTVLTRLLLTTSIVSSSSYCKSPVVQFVSNVSCQQYRCKNSRSY